MSGLPVGGRHDNGFEKLFPTPVPGIAKLNGEPIEEFRMSGCASLGAEIFFSFHESVAEDACPDAVDGDARR